MGHASTYWRLCKGFTTIEGLPVLATKPGTQDVNWFRLKTKGGELEDM